MWRAPVSILGKYCILDAESTYLLYTEILSPVLEYFPGLRDFYYLYWMPLIELHIEQKLVGIPVDREGLQARQDILHLGIQGHENTLRTHPSTQDAILGIESELREELASKEPERYLKQKVRPPEPPKYRKDGAISKTWTHWVENEHKYTVPVQSRNWENWRERWEVAVRGDNPDYRFNLDSGHHLQKLLYQYLGYEVKVLTESGQPATGLKALKAMGEIGQLLIERNWLEKERTYVTDYIQRTETRGTIHPSYRLPGTSTGRLSSKGPNLQQVPKSKAVMSLFIAPPGKVWVDLDFAALEPTVATYYSGDENLMQIYGDGRPPNDIYLFVGSHISSMKQKILEAGYNPSAPTKEGISNAKKVAKHERNICKTVTLACIAEDTPILVKGRGYLPIQDVRDGDQVWDGADWVRTTGAIDKGNRVCYTTEGVEITPDHLLLSTRNTWHEAQLYNRKIRERRTAPQLLRPKKPSATWSDIWEVVCSLFRSKTYR
jgi:hypothetical protein